jgi:hypothetical protein
MLPDEFLDGRVGDPPVFAVMNSSDLAAARQTVGVAFGKSENLADLWNRENFLRAGRFVGRNSVRCYHRHDQPRQHLTEELRKLLPIKSVNVDSSRHY